ncbi:uncharacterized protein LOC120358954 isoform X1 [Solenopsis invicta]|uniref:uncharacterized protein LOC120358833 isoform X2 n=2 Tax=Solenopsis invicta TaxID=13686 RepID=UPI00193CA6A1|nr:uncharacterized protein LOC120358833 isoform X2 [Solenopsis invicta]XP_039310859.1 uncharacterized protein LOC120358954 isoform X1 [Solenopsis invicta]
MTKMRKDANPNIKNVRHVFVTCTISHCLKENCALVFFPEMAKPTWTIIKFTADNTVEAVPSTWIEHSKCYWPPFKYEQIIAAIRKNVERNTCWPSYDIITFRNSTYDDYNVARQKTKKAECTSDLNSEVEDTKRKRTRNPLFVSDTCSDSDQENNAPTKQKHVKESINIKKSLNVSTNGVTGQNLITKVSEQTPSTSTCNLLNSNYDVCDTQINLNNVFPATTPDDGCNANYFKEIIRQQGYFRTQLWQIVDDLREMKNVITGLNLRQDQDNNQQQDIRSIYSSFDLPLKTVENIETVEQFLRTEENFKRSTTETCKIGGTSPYNFIKRSLCRLITNELAQQYSWLGAKLKKKFCNLRITKMLLAAGAEYSNSTYSEIELEKAIQKWLKRAKERYDAERKKLEAHENRRLL